MSSFPEASAPPLIPPSPRRPVVEALLVVGDYLTAEATATATTRTVEQFQRDVIKREEGVQKREEELQVDRKVFEDKMANELEELEELKKACNQLDEEIAKWEEEKLLISNIIFFVILFIDWDNNIG